jgi:putative hydrolase of the HAD superfamily
MIKAMVFDFDGVILDTESALLAAYGDVHRAHGMAYDHDGLMRAAGTEFDFDPWKAFDRTVDRTGLEHEHRKYCDARFLELPILPGVEELLISAVKAGLPVGLASNSGSVYIENHLTRLNLRRLFSFLSCRESAAAPKPAPDLYLNVTRHFGLGPGEAIAFEDSATGTLAAKRAGLRVVAIPNPCTASHDFTAADLRIHSLADWSVAALVAKLQ